MCVCLCMCVFIWKQNYGKFVESILLILQAYRSRGIFNVTTINANKVFDSIKSNLKDELYQVILNMCNANTYVEVIEQMIKFLNEWIQVVRLGIPCKKVLKEIPYQDDSQVVFLSTPSFIKEEECIKFYHLGRYFLANNFTFWISVLNSMFRV